MMKVALRFIWKLLSGYEPKYCCPVRFSMSSWFWRKSRVESWSVSADLVVDLMDFDLVRWYSSLMPFVLVLLLVPFVLTDIKMRNRQVQVFAGGTAISTLRLPRLLSSPSYKMTVVPTRTQRQLPFDVAAAFAIEKKKR